MKQTAIALKYARALFASALEGNRVNEVGKDVESLLTLGVEEPAFLSFLVSPEVLAEDKVSFLATVFEPRVDQLTSNFLRLLVERHRIPYLEDMCAEYTRLYEEHQGKLRAQVLTAVPLNNEQEARLKGELDRITGKNILIEKKVDPAMLGGVIVHLGNKIIDRSLRYGLKQLEDSLLRAEVN